MADSPYTSIIKRSIPHYETLLKNATDPAEKARLQAQLDSAREQLKGNETFAGTLDAMKKRSENAPVGAKLKERLARNAKADEGVSVGADFQMQDGTPGSPEIPAWMKPDMNRLAKSPSVITNKPVGENLPEGPTFPMPTTARAESIMRGGGPSAITNLPVGAASAARSGAMSPPEPSEPVEAPQGRFPGNPGMDMGGVPTPPQQAPSPPAVNPAAGGTAPAGVMPRPAEAQAPGVGGPAEGAQPTVQELAPQVIEQIRVIAKTQPEKLRAAQAQLTTFRQRSDAMERAITAALNNDQADQAILGNAQLERQLAGQNTKEI